MLLNQHPPGNSNTNSEGDMVCCPSCQEPLLHQNEVEVFDRDEDAREGQHVHITNRDAPMNESTPTQVTVDTKLVGNPSIRRQGIAITLWCESCQGRSTLLIYQHKGCTYMHWKG